MGNIERYRQIAEVNQDSVYWQLTARFGTLHIKACHDFAEEAIKTWRVYNEHPRNKWQSKIKKQQYLSNYGRIFRRDEFRPESFG